MLYLLELAKSFPTWVTLRVKLWEIYSPSSFISFILHPEGIFALYLLCDMAVISHCPFNYILKSFTVSYLPCYFFLAWV